MALNFMPWYVGDYLRDTGDLTLEEHGAYLLLMGAMWARKGGLPADHARLARVLGTTRARVAKIWSVIGRFFDVVGDEIVQARVQKELEKTGEKLKQKSQSGRLGGIAKASRKSAKQAERDVANATFSPSVRSSETLVPTTTSGSTTRSEGEIRPPDGLVPVRNARRPLAWDKTIPFLRVFERYPNGNASARAASVWQEIAETFDGGELALEKEISARFDAGILKRHPYAGDPRFCPLFENFLAEGRWKDRDPIVIKPVASDDGVARRTTERLRSLTPPPPMSAAEIDDLRSLRGTGA